MGVLRKIVRVVRNGEAIPLLRAIHELALGRLRLRTITPKQIAFLNGKSRAYPKGNGAGVLEQVERVTLSIRRAAKLVPWRSDCLVQALSAQRWLAAHAIQTKITIQVGRSSDGEFLAHATLNHEGDCILGQSAHPLSDIYAPTAEELATLRFDEG